MVVEPVGKMNNIHNQTNKKVVFFCPGPEYLFWAAGVYFVWELSKTFHVVLLTDSYINNVERIQGLVDRHVLHEFIQYRPHGKSRFWFRKLYRKHRYFKNIADRLFEKYDSVATIQHTDLNAGNIYFFEKAKEKKNLRLIYRPSAIPKDYFSDYILMRNCIVERLQQKWTIGETAALAFFGIQKFFSHYFNYWIFPLLTAGKVFRPRISPIIRKEAFFNGSNRYFDTTLAYSGREKKIMETNGEPADVVRNSINYVGREVNEFIYGKTTIQDRILILPTSGEIDYIKKQLKLTVVEAVECFTEKWVSAIRIIREKFPKCKTLLKLHPMQVKDVLFSRVVKKLLEEFKDIELIEPAESAEKLMLESKVVISTMSSVLWWISQVDSGERVLISLDLWNVLTGDKYSDFEGIYYFKDIEKLNECNFDALDMKSHVESLTTLTRFMSDKLETV